MKTKSTFMIAVCAALLVALAGCSTTAPAPEKAETQSWRFNDIVDVAFVQQHVTVPMAENVMVIDSRPKRAKYDRGHIPMAVSIPDSKFASMTDNLPTDKNALLIFYCGGPT